MYDVDKPDKSQKALNISNIFINENLLLCNSTFIANKNKNEIIYLT